MKRYICGLLLGALLCALLPAAVAEEGAAAESGMVTLYAKDGCKVELAAPEPTSGDGLLTLRLRFAYENERSLPKGACFDDLFDLWVFQEDRSCPQAYVDGYYSGANAQTAVRNGQSVDFELKYSVNAELHSQIVLAPKNTRSADDCKTYDVY